MSDEIANIDIPSGLKILHTLRYPASVSNVAWSPDGRTLAVSSTGPNIQLWNVETGELGQQLEGHSTLTMGLAWSPDGRTLAVSSTGPNIQLWNVETGKLRGRLKGSVTPIKGLAWSPNGQTIAVMSPASIQLWNSETGKLQQQLPTDLGTFGNLAWSPDGRTLALSGDHNDKVIQLWDIEAGKLRWQLEGHSGYGNVAWSPDGRTLAVGSTGPSIQIWDFETGQVTNVLEGHTRTIRNVSFSSDGRILASRDINTIRLWDCKPWNSVAVLQDPYDAAAAMSLPRSQILAFHPRQPLLATISEGLMAIYIWELDLPILLGSALAAPLAYYTNAKVVLVGDSGVGKSGLGLVLSGEKFVATESTHGRHVWTFDTTVVDIGGSKETRETLLWDLAGQPGYRLIHQLHLDEVAVALVVFDAHSEIDPFAGVRHWDRALRPTNCATRCNQ